ncbi:MAG TPA: tRNA (guanosine(46)-N7)-methyltransferase TrmB [Candidatus Cloacimonas sp.]|nr:tRNA (guanosine(46)-N7)-methyltransferase TrmB [Candidatus Cloacimonas sp.]
MISDRDFFVIKPRINEQGKFLCLNPVDIFPDSNPLYLEIGCGKGEFISHYSIIHPEYNYIGLESAEKRINNTLKKLTPEQNPNVRLMRLYVDDSICQLFPAESVSGVFIQYPDPWPKRKHHRRRLIQKDFLSSLAIILKPLAQVQITTDNSDYASWILDEFLAHPSFISVYEELLLKQSPFDEHITTWYESEQKRQGFEPQYMLFKRI